MLWNTDPQALVEALKEPGVYVVAGRSGLYDIRTGEIGTFIARAKSVSHLADVREGVVLNIPRVPFSLLDRAINFFYNYKEKYNAEARYQIFWDREKKEYFYHIPKFTSTEASLETERSVELEREHLLVVDLHSHLSRGAFFSPTDDLNEMESERFYGVIAVGSPVPMIKLRFSCGGNYVYVNPWVVFEPPLEW